MKLKYMVSKRDKSFYVFFFLDMVRVFSPFPQYYDIEENTVPAVVHTLRRDDRVQKIRIKTFGRGFSPTIMSGTV